MKIKTLCRSLAAAALLSTAGIAQAATTGPTEFDLTNNSAMLVGRIAAGETSVFNSENVSGFARVEVLSFAEASGSGTSPFRAVFEFFANGVSAGFVDVSGSGSNVPVGSFNFTGEELIVAVTAESGAGDFGVGVSIVPVPAAGLLLMTAIGGMGFMRRRKTKAV